MTDNNTALAVREYSDRQLQQRIDLNRKAGYGLEKATPAQLNIIFLLCQRYQLDPVSDITLYEGRPWITIDGRLRLLRAHPDYRGFDCQPLSKQAKEDWGYDGDDIVVEATIRTASWGEIRARGKVAHSEVETARVRAQREGKRAAPIGVHPVEIAEKRALARAERAAFGQDTVLDDEQVDEAVRTVVEERNDPVRVATNAAAYDRIYGDAYDLKDTTSAVQPPAAVQDAAPAEPPSSAGAVVDDVKHPAWKRWQAAVKQAHSYQVEVPAMDLGVSVEQLDASTNTLLEMVADAKSAVAEV